MTDQTNPMTTADAKVELVERVRDLLTRATPGPWRIATMGGEKQKHVVDMGKPPTAPFVALNDGAPSSAGFTGFPHSAVVHSDGDSCEIEANAELIALVPEMAAAITALEASPNSRTEAITDEMIEAGAAALFSVSDFEGQYSELSDMSKQIYREKSYAVLRVAMQAARPIDRQGEGVPASPSGCQPSASAAEEASSQSGIPNAKGENNVD